MAAWGLDVFLSWGCLSGRIWSLDTCSMVVSIRDKRPQGWLTKTVSLPSSTMMSRRAVSKGSASRQVEGACLPFDDPRSQT
jgi:hypothetical protein